jgi:hypothetical protein
LGARRATCRSGAAVPSKVDAGMSVPMPHAECTIFFCRNHAAARTADDRVTTRGGRRCVELHC